MCDINVNTTCSSHDHHTYIRSISSILAVACTNTKLMMEVLNGVFPPNTTQSRFKVHDGRTSVNFTLWSLPVAERQMRLKKYYKFVILRDPIVRLLSAYIDKVSMNQRVISTWDVCTGDPCTVDLCTGDPCTVDLCTVDPCTVDQCTVDPCTVNLCTVDLCTDT